jgi:NADPH:quinone reductase-like Zn-dependent oxidoreductase
MRRLRRALGPRGTVVFVGGENGGNLTGLSRQLRGALLVSPFVRQRLVLFMAKERAVDYERLARLIEAGKVTPRLDRSYQLDEAPDAMRLLQQGQVRGKVAITV